MSINHDNKLKLPKTKSNLGKESVNDKDLKDFIKISIVILFIGDLLLCYYIWSKFSNFDQFSTQMNQSLSLLQSVPQFQKSNLPSNFHSQMHQLVIQSLKMMLGGLLIIHSLVYGLYFSQKGFAFKYIKLMVWPAAIGSFLIAFAELSSFNFTYLFFPVGVLYIYVAIHLKKIRYNETGFSW